MSISFNGLRKYHIRRDEKYNQFKISLLEALVSGASIDKIINDASNLIGNSLVVIDLSFKVLASSSIENITDLLWKDNVQKGYCSYEFISELTKLETIKEGRKAKHPYEVTCHESPIKKIVCKIDVDGKTIGNIILLECKKQIAEDDYKYLMLVSEVISKKLEEKQFYKNARDVLTEEILYDLLENNIDETIMKERLKNHSLVFSNHMSVLVVDISNYELKHSVYARYLNLNLLKFFPISHSIYYNENIVIIDGNEQFIEKKNEIEKVKDFLSENNLRMGISSEFSLIEDCKIYYGQAIKSLEIGKIVDSEKCIYKFEDIQPYNFIYMTKARILKEDFYNNSLYMLKKYDDKNGSELYKTLYAYLKNNHSMTKTAGELFIHRNTLRYRLEKIVDIIGIDLDEDDNSFKIYYAFKSMDFYKKISNIEKK
jgi:sugar diacid utilization regulator